MQDPAEARGRAPDTLQSPVLGMVGNTSAVSCVCSWGLLLQGPVSQQSTDTLRASLNCYCSAEAVLIASAWRGSVKLLCRLWFPLGVPHAT